MKPPALPAGGARPIAVIACMAILSACAPTQPSVTVEGRRFTVEVRDTPAGREQGLSGRTEVPPGTGMLFIYDDSGIRSYWMSGMLVPIDLAWIAEDRIVGVQTLQPCPPAGPCPTSLSPGPVDAVLEVAAGALDGIDSGAVVAVSD